MPALFARRRQEKAVRAELERLPFDLSASTVTRLKHLEETNERLVRQNGEWKARGVDGAGEAQVQWWGVLRTEARVTYRKWTGGPDQVLDYLNNARRLGPFPQSGLPLGGKTLVFTDPPATVTFPGKEGAMVTLSDIIQQLQAEVPGLHVVSRPGPSQQTAASVHGLTRYLAVYRDGGIGIGRDGTGNGLFGFSADEDTKVRPPLADGNIKALSRPTPAEYEVIVSGADEDFEEPEALVSKKRAT